MASRPRDLDTTLPSPSEMDNFSRCPALWLFKDRLWVKPRKERLALNLGTLLDRVLNPYMSGDLNLEECLPKFAELAKSFGETLGADDAEDWIEQADTARGALVEYLKKYPRVPEEKVIAVQPTFTSRVKVKIDYIVALPDGRVRIRERKMLSPFGDIDDEMEKYKMGFQPISYFAEVSKHLMLEQGQWIECVEFEFLVRGAPAKGKYRAKPPFAERRQVFVTPDKVKMWENSVEWMNFWMQELDHSDTYEMDSIPRFTAHCMQKWGSRTYPCEFYQACSTMTSPLLMPDQYHWEKEVHSGSQSESSGSNSNTGGSTTSSPEAQAPVEDNVGQHGQGDSIHHGNAGIGQDGPSL